MKNLTLVKLIMLTVVLSLFVVGCKKDDSSDNSSVPGSSTDAIISGRVTSPNGQVIGSAKITSGTVSTISDRTGKFSLKVSAGKNKIVIQTGSGKLFKTELTVDAIAGQTQNLSAVQTVLKQIGHLAYITGSWDEIEKIIIDTLGYSATAITVADLSNYTVLSGYNALFLNCGALEFSNEQMNAARYANLSLFLQDHGSIYASDYAVQFLTGDGNLRLSEPARHSDHTSASESTASTCMGGLLGGFISDSSLCTSKTGNAGMVTGATINDPLIVNLLGHSTIDIDYDLPVWEVINLVDSPMQPIITDNGGYGVLAVRANPFSNEYGGNIFYTTFHNEPQGMISQDVKNVLQYFILNL